MSQVSLYRKYRPQTFEDVIGQDHIVKTLISQIKNNNIGHAYLFSGTRGVGKTSVAKIFAKAINCTNPTPNFSPCLNCPSCIENSKSSGVNVIEIDAASNNGVDNIRDLKEKIQFAPASGKYKVYIIDEVHMLSTSAFNALLKTLEEPPPYAIFILATTEIHKIPATILSRCTKFEFKIVGLDDLAKKLKYIFNQENIIADDNTIMAICKAGEGSVRDTLSIADMLSGYTEKHITYEKFLECMGTMSADFIYSLIKDINDKNVPGILMAVKNVYEGGKNIEMLFKNMMEFYRNTLIVKTVSDYKNVLRLPEDNISMLEKTSKQISDKKILDNLLKLSGASSELKYSINQRLLAETTFINMALYEEIKGMPDIDGIIEKKLAEKLKTINFNFKPENQTPTMVKPPRVEEARAQKVQSSLDEIEKEITKEQTDNLAKSTNEDVLNEDSTKQGVSLKESGLEERHIVASFTEKVRKAKLDFVLITLNKCSYKLIDTKLYIVCKEDFHKKTLEGFKPQLDGFVKEINSELTLDIVIDSEKIKTEQTIKELKNKFGSLLTVK